MANDIEEVKRRTNIIDLVSSYLTLKKAGKDYKALCPFHQEKTPSFFVSPEKQIFKCFGCGEGGDVFDFVMKQEGLEFGDTLKLLADRAGVTLTPRSKIDRETPGLKSRLYDVNRVASFLYQKILLDHPAGKQAQEYLTSRGVKQETIREFRIGFAPAQGPAATFITRKGFTGQELEKAGRPDRFSRRIMFPIFDPVGNVVGFSGRIVGKEGEPKYLNTPDTPIFQKGRMLFGLFQAKKAIKDADQAIIVEGQMDVIMSHQAGVANVIATSGSALTDDHLDLLFRYTPNLALAFDTDTAGEKAANRAILAALGRGFTVKLIPMTEKDPADLVKADPTNWRQAINEAKEAISYVIERAMSKYPNPSAEQKKGIAKVVLPYLAALSDPIEQETWVKDLASRLAVTEKTIYLSLSKVQPRDTVTVVRQVAEPKKPTHLTPPETLVGLVLAYPTRADKIIAELDPATLESATLATLFGAIKRDFSQLKKEPGRARQSLTRSLEPDVGKLADFLVFSVTHEFPDEQDASQAMGQQLARVAGNQHEELKREFASKIAQAEAAGQRDQVRELMSEFQSLIAKK